MSLPFEIPPGVTNVRFYADGAIPELQHRLTEWRNSARRHLWQQAREQAWRTKVPVPLTTGSGGYCDPASVQNWSN